MEKEFRCVGEVFGVFWGCYTPAFKLTKKCTWAPPTWSEQLGGSRDGCGLGWGGVLVGGKRVGREGRLEGLSCNVGVPCSMLSHMCGSWYFLRFLFNVGSLTLINIASFMVLE